MVQVPTNDAALVRWPSRPTCQYLMSVPRWSTSSWTSTSSVVALFPSLSSTRDAATAAWYQHQHSNRRRKITFLPTVCPSWCRLTVHWKRLQHALQLARKTNYQ